MTSAQPTISFLIPTLNAATTLADCLDSITSQDYPLKKIEIIIADGGSTDQTLVIAKKHQAKIFKNTLRTGESGKLVALKHARGEYVALIDSDNILPNPKYIKQMIEPLIHHPSIVGSEPIAFTYRPRSGFIERYSALLGANDPYAFFCGAYDRYSYLTHRWTGQKISSTKQKNYTKINLKPNQPLPTIGANGTFFRRRFLLQNIHPNQKYLFDIDIIQSAITRTGQSVFFAKTHNSIIHSFCESSITKFIRKQTRRVRDYQQYLPYRQYPWSKSNQKYALLFGLYSISIVVPTLDALRGFRHKADLAWFFHPIACWLSSLIYIHGVVTAKLGRQQTTGRDTIKQ